MKTSIKRILLTVLLSLVLVVPCFGENGLDIIAEEEGVKAQNVHLQR